MITHAIVLLWLDPAVRFLRSSHHRISGNNGWCMRYATWIIIFVSVGPEFSHSSHAGDASLGFSPSGLMNTDQRNLLLYSFVRPLEHKSPRLTCSREVRVYCSRGMADPVMGVVPSANVPGYLLSGAGV